MTSNKNNFDNNENEIITQRPKAMLSKIDRSKTAPSEQFFPITEIDGSDDRYSTYNYYIYYHSIKPRDPRLPVPTYKPEADLAFLRDKANNEDKTLDEHKDFEQNININSGDTSYEKNEDISTMMTNLNVRESNSLTGIINPVITGNKNSFFNPDFNNQFQGLDNDNFFPGNNMGYNINNLNHLGGTSQSKYQFSGGYQQNNYGQTNSNNFDYYRNNIVSNSFVGNMDTNDNISNSFMGNNKGGHLKTQIYQQQQPMQPQQDNLFYLQQQQQQPLNMRDLSYGTGIQNKMNSQYNNNLKQQQQQQSNTNNPYFMMNQQTNQYNNYNQGYMQNNMNRNLHSMNMNNNRMNLNNNSNNNLNFQQNIYQQQIPQYNQFENNYNISYPQNINMNNPYMMGGGSNFNTSPYNMNLINKGYPQTDFKRISLEKDKQANFDINITDINEMLGKIIEFCKDHNGSRLVQKYYGEASEEDKNKIFEKLFPHIQNLSVDVFGNYVIQKLFEFSDSIRRKQIIKLLDGQIFELTLHMYGCRVIQKAIEVIEIDEIRSVLKEIRKDIRKCIEDQNGNHVVQKLIEKLPKGEHNEILKVIYGNCFDLSVHQYGCRVIQRVFEFCREDDKEKILEEILNRAFELIQDQFGNYVIQHIVEKQGAGKCLKIYQFLTGKIYDFSVHKFASNVVEKCLTLGNSKQRKEIVDEILNREDNDSLLAMVRDKYGNYVVQKMIEYSDQKTKELIIKKISMSQALKKRDGFCTLYINTLAKHVINFIEKMGFPTPGTLAFQQQFGK